MAGGKMFCSSARSPRWHDLAASSAVVTDVLLLSCPAALSSAATAAMDGRTAGSGCQQRRIRSAKNGGTTALTTGRLGGGPPGVGGVATARSTAPASTSSQ
jgi:hypothetical protein